MKPLRLLGPILGCAFIGLETRNLMKGLRPLIMFFTTAVWTKRVTRHLESGPLSNSTPSVGVFCCKMGFPTAKTQSPRTIYLISSLHRRLGGFQTLSVPTLADLPRPSPKAKKPPDGPCPLPFQGESSLQSDYENTCKRCVG